MTFLHLAITDARRALHRPVLRALLTIALAGAVLFGVIAFVSASGKTPDQLHVNGTHPAIMADWWIASRTGDSILMIASVPLLLGGFFGGAAIAGGEWRAGTVATLLTFEPRRARLHGARLLAGLGLATLLALMLQTVFLSAALPAVLARGTTAGTDGAWWAELVVAVLRLSLLTAATVLIGVSLATLGRNTAFAMGLVFAWMAFGETTLRAARPALQEFLLAENVTVALTWTPIDTSGTSPSTLGAAGMITLYVVLLAALATWSFVRRDIHGVAP